MRVSGLNLDDAKFPAFIPLNDSEIIQFFLRNAEQIRSVVDFNSNGLQIDNRSYATLMDFFVQKNEQLIQILLKLEHDRITIIQLDRPTNCNWVSTRLDRNYRWTEDRSYSESTPNFPVLGIEDLRQILSWVLTELNIIPIT
jgi:hypothetical protein